jgi:hypothetical protein
MRLNTKKSVEELISYTILTDRKAMIDLLKSNGVKVSDDISDAKLTTAVLVANKKSAIFRKKLASLLGTKLDKAGEKLKKVKEKFFGIVGNSQDFGFTGVDDVTYMKGFTGVDDFSDFTGFDDFASATASERKAARAAAKQKKEIGKALSQKFGTTQAQKQGQTKVGAALSSLWLFTKENVLTRDNINAGIQVGLDKINADSLARQNAIDQQSIMLQQQQQDMQRQLGKGAGVSGNTILYVGIGVIALVGIGFLIYKQSKK